MTRVVEKSKVKFGQNKVKILIFWNKAKMPNTIKEVNS